VNNAAAPMARTKAKFRGFISLSANKVHPSCYSTVLPPLSHRALYHNLRMRTPGSCVCRSGLTRMPCDAQKPTTGKSPQSSWRAPGLSPRLQC
jgi:hypothetical protein